MEDSFIVMPEKTFIIIITNYNSGKTIAKKVITDPMDEYNIKKNQILKMYFLDNKKISIINDSEYTFHTLESPECLECKIFKTEIGYFFNSKKEIWSIKLIPLE